MARRWYGAAVLAASALIMVGAMRPAFAQDMTNDVGRVILGDWRTMIGTPSTFSQPSASVVFTTSFFQGGRYRTTAVVEGGNGYWGSGGTYIMNGRYEIQPPSLLRYRLEESVLCIVINSCGPGLPPGSQIGAVVSVNLRFEGSDSFVAEGQRWTRVR